ncbi:hypothetical protein [Frigoriglobus tundricola]|uniref:MoxR-vWA-beta-propeller ternary system domain-containing protein n=1 Tax=Frigoriglobus tundricola TaxID=2774151 RepID=A0A6M5Z0C3_9BACT|nr:hypothetical protein [Frigoriglobus tundricola]QJW98881.1 hypothetical protein FTUN_6476 [Frigoriglobus tundricola]
MTPPSDPWRDVTAARLPSAHLDALAPVRHRVGVRVQLLGADAWVHWPIGQADVVRCLLPVPGVAFFTQRAGQWVRFGTLVPTDDRPPDGEGVPLVTALVPARFQPLPPVIPAWEPLVLTVVRGGTPRPVVALACTVPALARWADAATTLELTAVRAAQSGGRAVLLGDRLPAIVGAVRYCGDGVLVPVGFRPEPELPDDAIRAAVGATADEVLLLDATGAERVPRAAFEPLTRAGVRMGAARP